MVYLEITLHVAPQDRASAAAIYARFKGQFLTQAAGALSKDLLIRDEDVQVLHRFDTAENAAAYLVSKLFTDDVVTALAPMLKTSPDIRIYKAT
jgi:hypothetical protein